MKPQLVLALVTSSFAVALGGCADNSFLELTLCTPAADMTAYPDAKYATVQAVSVRSGETPDWSAQWVVPPPPSFLIESGPKTRNVSVESKNDSTSVAIKVLFCGSAQCQDGDPAYQFFVEKPFTIGERSSATLNVKSFGGSSTIFNYKCRGGTCGPPGSDGKPQKVSCDAIPSTPDAGQDAAADEGDAAL